MPPPAADPLWRAIDRFELDDPDASLTFTRRLARENGWSVDFAARVVEEYKRFVYLAMTAGHEVTPSDEVDQAWHLHLTYTRSYWGELCGEVLGRPLHHGPTKGGKSEGERFEDQYERTLASYRAAFGESAPEDIWPPAAIRFGEAAGFVRVNRSRAWVLPKPWRVGGGGRPLAAAACLAMIAPPLAANEAGYFFLFLAVLFALVTGISILRGGKRRGRKGRRGGGSGEGWGGWFGGGCGTGCGGGCASGCGGGGGGGGGCGGGGCGGS